MEALLSDDWLSTIHLLGAAQGIFLAVILASKRRNSVANKILAGVMLAFTLELITTVYHAKGYDEAWPHFIGATYPFPFLFAPLLYLYAEAVSEGVSSFRKSYLLHLIPFALVVLYMTPFFLQNGADKLALLQTPQGHPWTPDLRGINHVKFVYSFIYLALIIRLLTRHRKRIKNTFSSIEHINLAWLRNMTIGGVSLWGIAFIFYLFGLFGSASDAEPDPIEGYDDYVALAMAVFVYAIGYLGLRQPEIFGPRMRESEGSSLASIVQHGEEGGGPAEPAKPQYAKSGMDPNSALRHVEKLLHLMENEKSFRKNDLTLQDLADALSVSPHNLSEMINTQVGKNFYDLVNGYRVEEVQRRLTDPGSAHLTVLALGLEAGFNSKSSFNAVFKKHTTMTPSQYRQKVGENVG